MATLINTSQPHIVRMGHPLAFAAFLRHIGAPLDKHFRRSGLPMLCEDPDAFVSLRRVWAFMDAAAQSEDPSLGWYVGRFVGDHNLNRALLRKLELAPTLLQALQRLVRLSSAEASHLQLGIREHREHIILFTHYPDMKGVLGYNSSQSYQLGVIIGVIRHFAGANWMPDEIGVECSVAPSVSEELFPNSRILARQQLGYITIPRSCLHQAPPRDNSERGGEDSMFLTKSLDFAATLRILLKPYLSDGYPSASLAASLTDTSVRTLARRLSVSGVTYRDVVDEVRYTEAKELLENSSEKIIDVGGAVGFGDPAHFARMFHRMAGISPRMFRRALR